MNPFKKKVHYPSFYHHFPPFYLHFFSCNVKKVKNIFGVFLEMILGC